MGERVSVGTYGVGAYVCIGEGVGVRVELGIRVFGVGVGLDVLS